jgi:hypothetical protein
VPLIEITIDPLVADYYVRKGVVVGVTMYD